MNTGCRKNNRKGFTLVEMLVVSGVLSIVLAIMIPSFSDVFETVNKKLHWIEAKSVFSSVQSYTIDQYVGNSIDSIELYRQLTMHDLDSGENPLNEYLYISCSPNSRIDGLTVDENTGALLEVVYITENHRITVGEGGLIREQMGR